MMSVPIWVERYIGIPFAAYGRDHQGCDCWGLLRLVLREQFGIEIPSFDGSTWRCGLSREENDLQRAELESLMAANVSPWRRVDPGSERGGHGILLRQLGRPIHVGVVVAPRWMLHIEQGANAVLTEYDGPLWRRKIAGFYEWRGAA